MLVKLIFFSVVVLTIIKYFIIGEFWFRWREKKFHFHTKMHIKGTMLILKSKVYRSRFHLLLSNSEFSIVLPLPTLL